MRNSLSFRPRRESRASGSKGMVTWASWTAMGLLLSLGSCERPPNPQAPVAEPGAAGTYSSGSVTIIASAPPSASGAASGAVATAEAAAAFVGWPVIGCFVGDAWSEALGAVGEERSLATVRRCRLAATRAFDAKPDDDQAFVPLRAAEPAAVQRAIERLSASAGQKAVADRWAALVRAAADAVRQVGQVQRAVKSVRNTTLVENERLRSLAPTLRTREPLAALYGLDVGPLSTSARGLALIVAASHLEAARGLEPRLKLLVASPAFSVVFGVDSPAEPQAGDWLTALRAAATAAGHPVEGTGAGREQAAFVGMERGIAERMVTAARDMEPGEGQDAVRGYAEKLQAAIDDVAARKGVGAASSASAAASSSVGSGLAPSAAGKPSAPSGSAGRPKR